MKKSIKFLGLAALAMVFAVACNNNKAAEEDTTACCDTTIDMVVDSTIEAEAVDTTTVAEETPAPAKKAVKKEEPKNSISADATKGQIKPNPKDVKLTEGNKQSVTVDNDANLGKKNAKEAFKKK